MSSMLAVSPEAGAQIAPQVATPIIRAVDVSSSRIAEVHGHPVESLQGFVSLKMRSGTMFQPCVHFCASPNAWVSGDSEIILVVCLEAVVFG